MAIDSIPAERLPLESRRTLARLLPRIQPRYAEALGAADWTDLVRSKLYDPAFGHRFRKAAATPVISQELPS